jgi:UDP-N-acetylmuramate--alanine ligase
MLYSTSMLVVTNVDFDHSDTFRDEADYRACFDVARSKARLVVEGKGLTNEEIALKVALMRGHDAQKALAVLDEISKHLPDRRFEMLIPGVYTDYAHHPAEIRYCLERARKLASKGGGLRVIFQPHRYSRTKRFLNDFARCFDVADELVLCPVYAAFEKPIPGGTSDDLYKVLKEFGKNAFLAGSCEEAWERVSSKRKDGDIIVLLGAGDIIDIAQSIKLKAASY